VVAEIAARRPGLRIDGGKKIFEVKPDLDWHKGRAVEWLLGAMGHEGSRDLPIYIGDDITDEDAFRTLRRLGRGIGIAVAGGSHATAAEWMLPGTDAVRHFLQVLEQELHRVGD
jgi:trehalose-phosphatase